ncbi:hypothetical protein AB0M32_09570 [Streptomyces sp. NPDC051985]|uniref:hypothetical protein n=1 Tax=Streptomyces sp. NPDC051985 TaxID=3155807 RepID=UPI00342111AA
MASKDAFNALAYGGRLVGVVFIAASLVNLVAALAVWDYWGKQAVRYSGTAVLVGVGTVTVTNLMFLMSQIQGRSYTPFLWLWIGLAIWSAGVLWTLTRRRVWQEVPHPRRVALGVLVSGAVGISGLAYSQMYVPYTTPMKTPFSVSFGPPALSADGSFLHVPEHVEFRNTGSVRIYVVGTIWSALGWPTRFTEKGTGEEVWRRELDRFDETVRHVAYAPSRMLGAGRFADPGARLDPGDTLSGDFVVDVPLHTGIGRVEIDATTSYIRADRAKLGNSYSSSGETSWDWDSKTGDQALPDGAEDGDDFIRFGAKIYHSSEMLNLTHATEYVNASWLLPRWDHCPLAAKGETCPKLSVGIARNPDGSESLTDEEQEPYGMATKTRWAEESVDQLLKAARK